MRDFFQRKFSFQYFSPNLLGENKTIMKMESLEVLDILEEFNKVKEAIEMDKKVKREFSLEKNPS